MRLHHVQLACPRGGEDAQRRFWRDGLGLTEVAKPPELAGRGGCWFRGYDGDAVTIEVHVGVEHPFRPALKAHPAVLVEHLDVTADRLRGNGFEVDESERATFAGYLRFHTHDGAGNRIEVMQPVG